VDNIDPAIVALALAIGYLTNVLTDVVKQVVGRSRHRRWLLPLSGLSIGIGLVWLLQVYRGAEMTGQTVAGCVLAGIVAFGMAALTNDQSKAADRTGDLGRGLPGAVFRFSADSICDRQPGARR
jgi:hypothetical protein